MDDVKASSSFRLGMSTFERNVCFSTVSEKEARVSRNAVGGIGVCEMEGSTMGPFCMERTSSAWSSG